MLDKKKQVKVPKKIRQGDLPKTKEEWGMYVNRLHDDGIQRRLKYEFQWTVNLSYYLGYQNLLFNYRTNQITIPSDGTRPLTINRIGSFIESRHAKLTKNRPAPRVIPNGNDEIDKNAAKSADKSLVYLWRKIDLENTYDKYIVLGLITGSSFIRTIWNPLAGDFITVPKSESGEIFTNSEGIETEKIFLGEVESTPLSSFSIINGDDNITEIKDQPWLIERSFKSVSEIELMYPHLKDKIDKACGDERTEYEKIISRLSSPISAHLGSAANSVRDSINSEVLVKIFWMRPNSQYENGVVCVVAGDQVAYLGEFPNDYGDNIYPYAKFSERSDGFHFWGQSTIERLTSIQRAYNRLRQKKLKNIYLMANGKWMVPKGAQLQEDALNDEESEVVEYNSAVTEPHQAQLAALPNYAVQMAQELISDFRDVAGQREASVAPPPNVTAGVALQIIAEQSDEILNPMIRKLASAMRVVANQQLLLMDQEYNEKRKIQILGDNGKVGSEWMSNADFRHHTDVHIEVESMFPEFKGGKQQRLLDLWDRRIISDPTTFLNAFRFGNFDEIIEKIENADDQVWMDITEIKKGKEPQILPYQDHMAYFRVMSDWIKTPEFLRLEEDRKQLALAVLQAHMQFLVQSLPNKGRATEQQNQNAVGRPEGPTVPEGAMGNVGPQGA